MARKQTGERAWWMGSYGDACAAIGAASSQSIADHCYTLHRTPAWAARVTLDAAKNYEGTEPREAIRCVELDWSATPGRSIAGPVSGLTASRQINSTHDIRDTDAA